MAEFLLAASGFVLAVVALGLFCVLRGSTETANVMAIQLFGTGGVAVLLLLAVATKTPSIVNVALILALFAAFASVAFVVGASISEVGGSEAADRE